VTLLSLGVVGTSAKENERRLPLHPDHFSRIGKEIRERITLETGYADLFGRTDADLSDLVAGFASREEIIETSDVVLLPKPQHADVASMKPGQVLWGWPHCVQDPVLTQLSIDRQLTLIAFEVMNHWTRDGAVGLHVFHKNNELAGYCSVLHAFQLCGITGDYGRPLSAVVIGFGATARGVVTVLKAHGIQDVHVLTSRAVAAVGSPIHSVRISQLDRSGEPSEPCHVLTDGGRVPLAPFLAERDVIVNCTLQDTAAPVTFLQTEDLAAFRPGSLIVDVSCDEGMGFSWATPTTFEDPMFKVGGHVDYYAVDHSPSYLWNSATWEVSEALLPFLETVLSGPSAWADDETITRAIEIRDGRIVNPAILAFQRRSPDHPHAVVGA
jgi:alanine dehydrogenase